VLSTTTAGQSTATPVKRTRSARRVWMSRCLALAFSGCLVLLLEVALRLLGMGQDLSLVVPIAGAPGWFQLNPLFDQPFYGLVDLSGPEPRPFQLPKPAGTRRILVVGGSTVVGFPYPSELAFSRHLEVALQEQCNNVEVVEVLNAGITAMNSATEVAVVHEGLRVQPDVIVVYTGHNEFYAPGGVASAAGKLSPGWFRTLASFRRLYLAQTLRRLFKPRAPSGDLIESLPGNVHIPVDGEIYKKGLERFRENLTAMALAAQRARIPILFVSPVSNEHDQPPIEDLRVPAGAAKEAWQEVFRKAERELAWGDAKKASDLLEQIYHEHQNDPLIHFRLAQVSERQERIDEARSHFARALSLDGCRFRASSDFRSVMASVADQHAPSGAKIVDLHQAVAQASKLTVPGRTHFLEHVHFTWAGNRLVGDVIARTIWLDVWSREWSTDRELDDAAGQQRLAVLPEDHLAAHTLAMTIYQKLPFRDGADAEKLAKDLIDDSVSLFRRLPADERAIFEQRTQQEMAGDLLAELIKAARAKQNDVLLGLWLRSHVTRQPWNCQARKELVTWLSDHGELDEAERVRQAADKWPCPAAHRH